ncbi:uncharacterized protein ACRADG_011197 isoform 2-T2 [Cochliomyia hominivorax]
MNRVYVGNLPPDIRIKDIDDFFRPFGKLIYIDVNHRANSVYAYVQFDSARNAFNAVKARHGYDYEGYTLQMRLVENEVRKRRDATPPPPPPMFSEYGNRMDRNYTNSSMSSSFQSSSNSQWSNSNNRSNMQLQQQNMGYSSGGRSNMSQDNMINYSNRNNFNMQQPNGMEYSNNYSNRYNMNDYRNNSNWVVGNNGNDGSWNTGNSSWNNGNNNWNSGNNSWSSANNNWSGGNNSWNGGDTNNFNDVNNSWNNANNNMSNMNWNGGNNNVATNVYNPNNDPYTRPGFEDNFTRGLSGSGRKWFNRYIRRGFSPEMARAKALEHRTVPYTRDDPKTPMPDPNDPTNVALETIGNTIISLLSTANPVDNNQIMPAATNWCGPSTSNVNREDDGRNRSQTRNPISRREYYKSLDILKKLKNKGGVQNAQDRLNRKFHLKIVKDYEQYEKANRSKSRAKNERGTTRDSSASGKKYTELSVDYRKKKQQLLLSARRLQQNSNKNTGGGAFKKRVKILMEEHGLSRTEAKSLAYHPMEKLQSLLNMKKECERLEKKKSGVKSRLTVYRNDIKYLRMNEKYRLDELSPRTKIALRNCLARIYRYENDAKIKHIRTKFTKLIPPGLIKQNKAKTGSNKDSRTGKKTNSDKNTTKKGVEEKVEGDNKKQKTNEMKGESQDHGRDNAEGHENNEEYEDAETEHNEETNHDEGEEGTAEK